MLAYFQGEASIFHRADPTYPPGPAENGLREMARDQLAYYKRITRDYGDFVPARFGLRRGVFINHPDLIEEVLVTQNAKFIKSMALRRSRRLLGNGLLTSEGDFWRRQRRLAQPAFHRQRIASYAETMVDATNRLLETWKDRETLDVHAEMMRLTLDIVSKTLFGADTGGLADEIGRAVTIGQEAFTRRITSWRFFLPDTFPLPENLPFIRAAKRLDEIIYRIIAERRAQRAADDDRPDLLSMLLAAQDDEGGHMTDTQLRDECMTLFLAGHETTALALSWAWYLLSQSPGAETDLHAELDEALAGRQPTMEDLPKLRFAEAVVNESMRLYPPAYVMGREAIEDVRLGPPGGHRLPKGMLVLFSQYVMHRDARYFDAPDEFRPQRWLDVDPASGGVPLQKRLPRFAYFPFGGGPRLCIGNQFAMMEAVLLLVTIAQRYRLRLAPGATVTPWTGITLRPKDGVRVTLEARKAPTNVGEGSRLAA
jgi:cytochrome P450